MDSIFVVTCMMRGYDDEPYSDEFHVVGVYANEARVYHQALPVATVVEGQPYHMLSFNVDVVPVLFNSTVYNQHFH